MGEHGLTNGRYTIAIDLVQSPTDLITATSYGVLQRGMLNNTHSSETWRFDGTQGDVVRLEVESTSGDLDSVLRLYSMDGLLIASGDDEHALDPIVDAILPQNGSYRIVVERFNGQWGVTSGNYALAITPIYQTNAKEPTANVLNFGSSASGVVDSTAPTDEWDFVGEKGDTVSIELRFSADDSPLQLVLRDPFGNALVEGIRDGETSNISAFVLPARGKYYIEVRRPSDARAAFSPYALGLHLDAMAAETASPGGYAVIGSSVTGRFLSVPATHAWVFTATSGELVGFLMQTLDGTTNLQGILLAPDGSTVATLTSWSDDPVYMPYSGTYTLLVGGDGITAGTIYRLTFRSADNADGQAAVLTPTRDGYGSITNLNARNMWDFDAHTGEVICVRVEALSGNLEPTLTLWDSTGRALSEGKSARTLLGAYSELCGIKVPATGVYHAVVSRAGGELGSQTGTYRILLRSRPISARAARAKDVTFGQVIDANLTGQSPEVYAFRALAGDVIALSATTETPGSVPTLSLETEDGQLLSASTGQVANETRISAFVVPSTGRYIVVVDRETPGAIYFLALRRDANAPPGSVTRALSTSQTFSDNVIDPAQPTYWIVSGKTGEVLTFVVDTTGGGLTADETLFAPSGDIIGIAIEGVSSRQTVIGPVRLPEDGDFTLVIRSWIGADGGTTGGFTVRADIAEPGISGSDGGTIWARQRTVYGGLIEEDNQDVWDFQGQAGEIVFIRAEKDPGPGELAMRLFGTEGEPIAQSAPATEFDGADIASALLPLDGTYSIVVTGTITDQAPIDYRLAVGQVQSPMVTSMRRATGLGYGELQNGTITDNERRRAWAFWGQGGDRIGARVSLVRGSWTPTLYLIGPDGSILEASDIVSDGVLRLDDALLPQTGFYGLVVERKATESDSVVEFTIDLDNLPGGALWQGSLYDYGTGDLTASAFVNEWSITPDYSGDYLVTIDTSGFVPRMYIVSPTGSIVNSENSSTQQATVIAYLRGGETSRLVVSGGPNTTKGHFDLHLIPASIITGGGALDENRINVGRLEDAHFTDDWTLQATAGSSVTVSAARISGDLVLSMEVFDENGLLLQTSDSGDNGGLTVTAVAPADGTYHLLVSRNGESAGTTSGNYVIGIQVSE